MDRLDLTDDAGATDDTGRTGDPGLIDDYLRDVAVRLCGPRRWREEIVEEVRDGLAETAAACREQGMNPTAAQRTAITEWGSARVVAGAYARAALHATGKRVGTVVLLGVPLLVATWWAVLSQRVRDPFPQPSPGVEVAANVLGVSALLTVVGALLAWVFSKGVRSLARQNSERWRYRASVTAVICMAAAMSVTLMVQIAQAFVDPRSVAWPWLALPLGSSALVGTALLMEGRRLVVARRMWAAG
ncbi:permease prefix domain 1-containing protein [Streptomyces sp. NPDC057375]|uniref:permease prefix domain 1-containing protein n=1 Tax=Streptomyces sp. NPDC057375 TaxID=3346109 RepID=UPI00362FF464